MSIEQLIADHTAALNENTAQLKILNAGREQALEAINNAAGSGEAKPARASRKKAEPDPNAAGNGAAAAEPTTGSGAAASPAAAEPAGPTVEEQLRDETTKYVDAAGVTDEQKAARIENVKAIMAHFGGMLCGPASKLDDDQRAQALFYLRRFATGCEVNFAQEYDFAGDPTQGGAAAAAEGADEFNIG